MKTFSYIQSKSSYCILVLLLFTTAIKQINTTNTKNVLVLEGVPSPSHHFWIRSILLELTDKGYNITSLTPQNVTENFKNLHYIHLELIYKELNINVFHLGEINPWMALYLFYDYGYVACNSGSLSMGWQRLLNYPDDFKFDLVLHDFFTGPCLLAFMDKFEYPPLISITAFYDISITTEVVGTILTPSITQPFTTKHLATTFLQRTHFFLLQLFDYYFRNTFELNRQQRIVQKDFPNLPNLFDIQQKHSRIVLLNNDPAIDLPEQFPPNVIKIGGLQIKKANRLPENIENIINASTTKGVVLLSFGTNVPCDMIGAETFSMIFETFAEILDYTFICKFDSNTITKTNVSSNVHTFKWLPQNDILAHPKTKLFITHAGLMSTQESTWHGVPMMGIPIFGDQFLNIEKSVKNGVAERLNFNELTKNNFKTLLEKLLTTSSYHDNMKIRSQNFRDQKETPMERAIWWIEWVLRNPNATHFKSPVLHMNYLQRQSIDVIAFLTICFVIIIVLIMGCMYCLCFKNKKNVIKKKND